MIKGKEMALSTFFAENGEKKAKRPNKYTIEKKSAKQAAF